MIGSCITAAVVSCAFTVEAATACCSYAYCACMHMYVFWLYHTAGACMRCQLGSLLMFAYVRYDCFVASYASNQISDQCGSLHHWRRQQL
jgi:hypothetical protein